MSDRSPRAWVTSPIHRAVVTSLIEARRRAGMTQRDLSSALRKPPSFIAKVEGGERNLSVLELLRIAQALGISASSLLSEIESRMPQGFDI